MKGATIIVKSLQELGVEHVFGYTGAAILPVMDELGKSPIKIIVNANEQCAAFAAAGYSRSTEKVGVAIVTSGPAITNTLTAVADSYADGIPLLVIAGQVPEHKIGTDSFQHIDVASVFGPTAKHVVSVNSIGSIETVIKDAYFHARSGKPGPVVIDLPLNLQQNLNSYEGGNIERFAAVYEDEHHLSDSQCADFFELLAAAHRPLLYLGGGLNSTRGNAALGRFNSRFGIPSVNTLMGKGVVDETAPSSLGLLGMFGTPYANKIIQDNDFFFAIGVRWDDRVAEKVGFAIHAKIAYIDVNSRKMHQIREERQPDFTFLGDAACALDDLSEYARRHDLRIDIDDWIDHAVSLKRSWPLNFRRDSECIQQAEVLEMLNQRFSDDMIVTTGVGNHQLLAAQYLKMRRPRRFLTSGSFGTMGFGMPVAVGACCANLDARVIVIDGDGSCRMNMGEMQTIGMLDLPVKILLLNNRGDGMVRNLEDAVYGGRHSATERPRDIDFAAMARLSHFRFAERVSYRDALPEAMDTWLAAQGPAMLEVLTDIEEAIYPVVRPGSSYAEMDLGPHIRQRNEALPFTAIVAS
jgi:acetolactate synthase I/II/III large subunit